MDKTVSAPRARTSKLWRVLVAGGVALAASCSHVQKSGSSGTGSGGDSGSQSGSTGTSGGTDSGGMSGGGGGGAGGW